MNDQSIRPVPDHEKDTEERELEADLKNLERKLRKNALKMRIEASKRGYINFPTFNW